jgi:hypothetical protein
VGVEQGPLSLVSTTEELLGRESSGSCLEILEYGCRDLLNFADKRQSLDVVRLRTKATQLLLSCR